MTPWRVEMAESALSDLEGLAGRPAAKILKAIRLLARDPSSMDIKKLEGQDELWRLKVDQ